MALKIYQCEKGRVMVDFKTYETKTLPGRNKVQRGGNKSQNLKDK